MSRLLAAAILLVPLANAAIGPDSTRADVIAEYGEPAGFSRAGNREVLSYPNGRVVLENGKVIETSVGIRNVVSAAGEAADGTQQRSIPTVNSAPDAIADRNNALGEIKRSLNPYAETRAPWITDFDEAKARAAAGRKRILVLFTGTDWCEPCQEFQRSVAYDEAFLKLVEPSFVLLKINWLRNTPQPKAEAEQTMALREKYGIATFPSLLVLAADGTQLMRVDTRKSRAADSVAEMYIQAVDEARRMTRDGKPVKSSWFPF